jgi:hypothetical protein
MQSENVAAGLESLNAGGSWQVFAYCSGIHEVKALPLFVWRLAATTAVSPR